ncbi:MAG: hypothetical protein F6K40_03110 [Okeania sp. SIO3I5]|uniref:hypothetical protein n=1 Tax=Okeania sp. SIO3I5 TaxID=2607805 RepID=UPI0013B5D863|nr:hypothetical protein [Okeania sp. SIO3I5]NEQ35351.1 hypothetical protein [Okeania sp. SIO3I5]
MKSTKSILFALSSLTCFYLNLPSALADANVVVDDQIQLDEPGLYLATATLKYDDGDVLKGDFRVYCPTSTIRPTNYVLTDKNGNVKKQGEWWEPAFEAKYSAEKSLITLVC